MKEQLISFETAKLAKEKGFGGKGFTLPYCYWNDKLISIPNNNLSKFNPEDFLFSSYTIITSKMVTR